VAAIGIHTTCPSGGRLPGADEEAVAGYPLARATAKPLACSLQVFAALEQETIRK
jgi:hypothetical protein